MKSVLIGKVSLLLVVVDTLIGLSAAAPSPSRTIQRRADTTNWEGNYEKEHPGHIVGPLVEIRDSERIDPDLLNWEGRFPIEKGVPPSQVREIDLNCRGKCKGYNGRRLVDMSKPMPTHSCIRDSLAALAYWRLYCDVQHKILRWECWTPAPSIARCCGQWLEQGKSDYPPMMKKYKEVIGGLEYYVFKPDRKLHGDVDMEHVIRPGWDQFKSKDSVCAQWRPGNEEEFSYFINNLPSWNLYDADNNGTVLGLNYPWYEPQGPGRFE